MKRIIALLMMLTLMLPGLRIAAAESDGETRIPYEELPAEHRLRFEEEMAYALANARARAPGRAQLMLKARGGFSGYSGAKTAGNLTVSYTVSDSIVMVGEQVVLQVSMSCQTPPMTYTVGGLVFDEDFNRIGDLNSSQDGIVVENATKTITRRFTPQQAGYFNFVIAVSDSEGNVVALSTNTVQVYEDEEPLFSNIGVDGNLGLMMSLNRSALSVGTMITADVDVTTKADPVSYTALWTLTDAEGSLLDRQETAAEVNAQNNTARLSFDYRPLQAGELQFVITATDADGNRVRSNTPVITVADGLYITARLEPNAALTVGSSLTAAYQVYGHECDEIAYTISWRCLDAEGSTLAGRSETVLTRSGQSVYVPRVGQEVECSIGAACSHFPDESPVTVGLILVGGLEAELTLTADTVAYGSDIGVNYLVEGGLEPYQTLTLTGYSFDSARNKTYTFLTRTLTAAEGTVTAAPKVGDEVYFVLEVVESDGNTTTWKSGKAALTGAPELTAPSVTASLSAATIPAGETITLTYAMSGGSGTINAEQPEASFVRWDKQDGTAVRTVQLTQVSGTDTFGPTEDGEYTCTLVLLDAYQQQVTWTSDAFTVTAGIPGDADANGVVDGRDALLVMQYDAGWPVTLNRANADVDGSGSVDLSDALVIFRMAAGE